MRRDTCAHLIILVITCTAVGFGIPWITGARQPAAASDSEENISLVAADQERSREGTDEAESYPEVGSLPQEPGPEASSPPDPVIFPSVEDTDVPAAPEATDTPPGLETGKATPAELALRGEEMGVDGIPVESPEGSAEYEPKRRGTIEQSSTWRPSDEDDPGEVGYSRPPGETFTPRPYELGFVGGVKRPQPGLDPRVRRRIETLRDNGGLDESAFAYGFLMIRGRLLRDRVGALEALGVNLIQRHPDNCWTARVPLQRIDEIVGLPFVYWFGHQDREQKLDLPVQAGLAASPFSEERRRIYVSVIDDDTSAESYVEPHQFGDQTREFFHSNGPMERALVDAGFEVVRFDRGLRLFVTVGSNAAINRILDYEWVLYVEYEPRITLDLDQSSPLGQIDEIWNTGYNGDDISVGILDSGCETGAGRHNDLDHISSCGIDYTSDNDPWWDRLRHGTHVAGIMAGNSDCDAGMYHGQAAGIGTGNIRFRIAKITTVGGWFPTDGLDAMDWMEYANPGNCDNTPKAQVVNNSWGLECYNGSPLNLWGTDSWSRKADEQVYEENMVMVFSAGNGLDTDCDDDPDYWGPSSIHSPGVAKNVVTVAACYDEGRDQVGDHADFSSRGPTGDNRLKPDVNAPGCDNDYGTGNEIFAPDSRSSCDMDDKCGTSMAAPHVTGIVASLMDHYSWLRDDPSRVKAYLMARAIPHGNSLSSGHDYYGTGRVDAYVAHYRLDGEDGWYGENFHGTVDDHTWIYQDIWVYENTSRMVIVLAWDEPAAFPGAPRAVTWDLDLYADLWPYGSAGNEGEYYSISSLDNVEIIRLDDPPSGHYRIKVYNYSAPAFGLHADVSCLIVRGDTSPAHNLTLSSTDQCVQPGVDFDLTVTASFGSWIGSCLQAEITSMSSAFSITGLTAQRENGVVFDYFSGDDELTLGSIHTGDSRSCTWTFRTMLECDGTVVATTDTDNAGTRAQVMSYSIDGTPPGLATFTGSVPATNTWSNDNTVFVEWDPATDDRCGVDGYGEWWATSPTGAPSQTKDLEETVTSTTSDPLSEYDWYYKLNTVDDAGNWSTGFAVIGPFKIDITQPEAVTNLQSTSHTPGDWSADNTIDLSWSGATDNRSGIDGYAIFLNQFPALPSASKDIEEVTSYTTEPLGSTPIGLYFNIRSVDNAGNWDDDFKSVGPFKIDISSPLPVMGLTSTSHMVDVWSNDTTIDVVWDPAGDLHSGVAGYSIEWSEDHATIPDEIIDLSGLSTTSPSLVDGEWWFHVRAIDNVANPGATSHLGPFLIDATVPTNPTVTSSSHTVGECSTDCTIDVEWSGASGSPLTLAGLRDGTFVAVLPEVAVSGFFAALGSGVAGYSIEWTQQPDSWPDEVIDTTEEYHTSHCLNTGDWWFHLRTVDVANNWSDPVHLGPFTIDEIPPTNPTRVSSSSHAPSFWSRDRTVDAEWSGASDPGCGIAGYSIEWTETAGTVPDETIDTADSSTVSPELGDGASWHLHIRSIDGVAQAAAGAFHFGPFWIDGTAPVADVIYPNGGEVLVGLSVVEIRFDASDIPSGIGNVKVHYSRNGGSTWPVEIYDGPDPGGSVSWTVPDVRTARGRIRVTVRDLAMNTTSDTSDADFRVDPSTTAVGAPAVAPTVFALLPVMPNPLRTSAAIRFDLPEERHVELDVLDVSGRHVATLVRTTLPAGEHVVMWDGHDRSGTRAAPGVYLYRLVAGDFTATRKMVVAP